MRVFYIEEGGAKVAILPDTNISELAREADVSRGVMKRALEEHFGCPVVVPFGPKRKPEIGSDEPISPPRPWEAAGVSRATWYRRKRETPST